MDLELCVNATLNNCRVQWTVNYASTSTLNNFDLFCHTAKHAVKNT